MTGDLAQEAPSVLVVMGVSGSGKTTIAALLADRLHWPFADGDVFHPPANVEKMRSGSPLTDEDREPWLQAIAAWIDQIRNAGGHAVVACSVLKRRYRAVVIGNRADVRLIYLQTERALIARRLKARHGHFMPSSLLQSQIEALEEPGPEENPITVSIAPSPEQIVEHILARLPSIPK